MGKEARRPGNKHMHSFPVKQEGGKEGESERQRERERERERERDSNMSVTGTGGFK
jgi:hypothetical protein